MNTLPPKQSFVLTQLSQDVSIISRNMKQWNDYLSDYEADEITSDSQ